MALAVAKRSENVEATSHQKIIIPISSDSLGNGAILRAPTKMATRRAPCSVSQPIHRREREREETDIYTEEQSSVKIE